MNKAPANNNDSRLWALLRAYRIYWMTPIVLGLVLLALVLIFADSETLGRFSYFNF
ncbi:MAG: hypothetical protein HQ513_05655 [Rhodospirillales bacterium]|nr:hypothetical protein [Rhodospirillales bacterium]